MQWARAAYRPALDLVLRNPLPMVTAAVVAVVLSVLLATRMGAEFVPSLNEGDVALHAHPHSRHQPHAGDRDAAGDRGAPQGVPRG